ncbi:MAG: HAD-IIB family hydrolase [bacterium]|nr:HAD-IIB family hydrolase [bacterium]
MGTHGRRYIMLISAHGLVRGTQMELGRDADTGGQIKYVVELARALIEHPEVEKVDLITRLIDDSKIDDSYAAPVEELAPGANIVRIRCGPNRYLAKESLWPHLDGFVDNILEYLRSQGRAPDLIHGHYADAGHMGARLAGVLNIPMVFTGHSLGRVKRQRLLDQGTPPETVERRYRITRRIEAEETALDNAALVIASTHQEVEEQYAIYDHYQPQRMVVIPPGVDLSRYSPPGRSWPTRSGIFQEIRPFLADWGKPMILALSRPDPRKNITTLIQAYGEHPELRKLANLVVVAGTRDDIRAMDKGTRRVMVELLYLIDRHNLYGSVAYPKHHNPDDIPDLYRLAAKTKGVFVNPALTEPFGLTLIEAAASGLPIVATEDGGPRDITGLCKNGVLIDPLDPAAMGAALYDALTDGPRWKRWSRSGIRGAQKHFSWSSHANKYLRAARMVIHQSEKRGFFYGPQTRLITADRILVTDIDNTLTGDPESLRELLRRIREAGEKVAFGIATGRSIDLTLEVLKKWKIPTPQLLITSVGSKIHYGPHLVLDEGWQRDIDYRWRPDLLKKAMGEIPGLKPQGPEGQADYKISFDVDPRKIPDIREIVRFLRRSRLQANVVYSHQAYLDLLPIRASKGSALRYFATKWGIPVERCMVAGDSGNDEGMLTGNTLAVVVGNYDTELEKLRGEPHIYFADGHHAQGIIEGLEHYDFFGEIRYPTLEEATHE